MKKCLLIALLIALTAFVSGCRKHKDSSCQPGPLTVKSLGCVKVNNGRIIDGYGRQVLLKGVNVKAEGLFDVSFDDGRLPNEVVPLFDESDAREIAYWGFNFVRLCITWSGLEPNEGDFSQSYLERLDQVIGMFREVGVYVLVDFHEDAYSKEIGEDGAPLWAIIPMPGKLLSGPVYSGPGLPCPCDSLDARRLSGPVLDAFESFFKNTEDIQDRFMPAWKLVAGRYATEPAIIGFEAMNEPVAFHVPDGVILVEKFHENAVRALRAKNQNNPYWLEPEVATRNFSLEAPLRTSPFPDSNIVYEPHLYPGLAGVNATTYTEWRTVLKDTFDSMIEEAASWKAAPVLGEWGWDTVDPAAPEYIDAIHSLADERLIGTAVWVWKEYGGWGMYGWDWGNEKWYARQPGLNAHSRPYPMAVPGRLTATIFDRSTQALTVTFTASGNEGMPMLYIPEHRYPNGYVVQIDGKSVEPECDADLQRCLVPWNGSSGTHTIKVTKKGG